MATIINSPAAELNIVCDQEAVFPATIFTILNKNTGLPVDLTEMEMEVIVRESSSTPAVLEWKTSDDTITYSGDDNENMTLEAKRAEVMNIEAKTYLLEWWVTQPGIGRVRYSYGNLVVRATGG